MLYKIEMRYAFRWGDAEWKTHDDEREVPMRFESIAGAQAALEEFFSGIREAVRLGDMDVEANRDDYRIVDAMD